MSHRIIFRQLFEPASCTYTYILGCKSTRQAAIIDPVIETVERDAQLLKELKLDLVYGLNTHVHADHVTGTAKLRKVFPSMRSVLSKHSGGRADMFVGCGDKIKIGSAEIEVRETPGHTNGCLTYVLHSEKMAFTGDALLIRGCGRTDFQQGDAHKLYNSVWDRILSLHDDFDLFPGHNYTGIMQTSVAEEKEFNPRLRLSEEKFVEFMKNLNLPYPKQIDRALPANLIDGALDEIRQG